MLINIKNQTEPLIFLQLMDFNVILVDDDAVVLFLHKMLLERSRLPSPSGVFQNGKEALEFIAKKKSFATPCLVLLDINMPIMNGWEFLEAVQKKQFRDKIFVAMVTSSINSQDANTAMKYPQVIDYIEKPLRKDAFEHLRQKICRIDKLRKSE